MRKILRHLAARTPGIASLLAAKRAAEQRRVELRDAVGNWLIANWRKELREFEPQRARDTRPKSGPIAQITWNISQGGAAQVVRALHGAVAQQQGSLLFYGNAAEMTADPCAHLIEGDALSEAMIDYAWAHSMRGFCSPTTSSLIETLASERAAVAHLHNCHPDYFNLFQLPQLSDRLPTVWTLHDEYAYTGHCGITLGCDGWTEGCSPCPYIKRYVEMSSDRAAEHFRLKQEIYDKARLTVVCVSEWLASRARRGLLREQDIRVIPNGVNTDLFKPSDKKAARAKLNLPQAGLLIGFCADGGTGNPWKGGSHLPRIAQDLGLHDGYFLCVGGDKRQNRGSFIDLGYLAERQLMADAYNAADIWLHPSDADSFGLVVSEAMACGVPVISSSAGALPELVEHRNSGILVQPGDTRQIQQELRDLASNRALRLTLGAAGRKRIESQFSERRMIEAYLSLYAELLSDGAPRMDFVAQP